MNEIKNEVLHFLNRHDMGYDIAMDALFKAFIDDMNAGLSGKPQSLLMIPTYMKIQEDFPLNEPIIVMDAGGTNFRVAQVKFDENGRAEIEHFAKYPMPGTQKRISKDTFVNTMIDYMQNVQDSSDKVGFCFSFPSEILPNGDGRLLGFTKEIEVEDSVNMVVGESINEMLIKRGLAPKKFTLLNDTVAAMFSGICGFPGNDYESYIGLILGTGTNTCYMESIANIKKIDSEPGMMAINMESGAFSGFAQGDFDKELDAQTNNPGKQTYEKMVSGAYRGDLIYRLLVGAAQEDLLSPGFRDFLQEIPTLQMKEIGEFIEQPFGDNLLANAAVDAHDRIFLHYLIDANFERVAKMMTVNIGSILIKTGAGKDPTRPVCIIAEGTVFHSSPFFRRKLDYYIKSELNERRGLFCEFISMDDATLIGSAIAGLMNA